MLDAFERGDYEAALEMFDPAVEGDFTHMADGRVVRGRAGIRAEIARWLGTWADLTTEWEAVLAGSGNRVLVLVRQSGTGKGSGAPMEMRYGQVFTVGDGAILAMKTYLDRDEARRAAGTAAS